MLGFNHTLAGSIIALITPAPIVPVVAYISHFVLDVTPHFGNDERFKPGKPFMKRLIVVDGILCVLALLFAIALFPEKWLMIGIGAFFSVLPDLQWIFSKQLHTPEWFLDVSAKIQWAEFFYGWILDVIYAIIFIVILMKL